VGEGRLSLWGSNQLRWRKGQAQNPNRQTLSLSAPSPRWMERCESVDLSRAMPSVCGISYIIASFTGSLRFGTWLGLGA
jgi:hypothetical protein